WQRDMSDSKEFLSGLKNDLDLFSDSVYCFTPTGDVKNLPAGSIPVDFAYAIHSAVGNKMVGARVNGKLVNIDYVLQNGDRVEIITSQNSKGPSQDWLKMVKSTQAKNKINQWFKSELKDDRIQHGKDLLAAYCKAKSIQFSDISKPEFLEVCMHKYGFRDWESVLAAIGRGALKEGQIINRLVEEYNKKQKKEMTDEKLLESLQEVHEKKLPISVKAKSGIMVQGIDDVAVHFSKCCSPVPGDEIIGYVTRGRGVSIHRTDCINVINAPNDDRIRFIPAEWNRLEDKREDLYFAEINVFANNRSGVLLDITKILTENKVDISTVNSRISKQGTATITLGFEVHGADQLNYLVNKIRNVESVLDVERTTG
ncbi:MAG: bifunctional (p)ppGpp synthetase/guanosine-3',5'-bis(diphosphate) 3'-pyrophosphohydrolase, partial [Lachnospiraceae bacterium]|nr:bifunctional (p)ppGpp synthetase/guanosine-3',5'-bis(diphosphate) 3'-pyrophosphohydrolase [Lachnospiraceae bacterium]